MKLTASLILIFILIGCGGQESKSLEGKFPSLIYKIELEVLIMASTLPELISNIPHEPKLDKYHEGETTDEYNARMIPYIDLYNLEVQKNGLSIYVMNELKLPLEFIPQEYHRHLNFELR